MAFSPAQLKKIGESHSVMKWDDELRQNSNTVLYSKALEHLDDKKDNESVIITSETQLAAIVYRNYVGSEPKLLKRTGVKDNKTWTAYTMLSSDVADALVAMKEMYS